MRALRNTVREVLPTPPPGEGRRKVAPFVDWTAFSTWDTYVAAAPGSGRGSRVATAARKRRKLGREVGAVTFTFDEDPRLATLLASWRGGRKALTAPPARGRALNERLAKDGLLTVSTLRAGGEPVAAVLGHVWDGKYFFRMPAFDSQFADYSAGTILLHDLLSETLARGLREVDLLNGDHAYKWVYATGARILGTTPPLSRAAHLRRAAGRWLGEHLLPPRVSAR